jgi:hypothetical protein
MFARIEILLDHLAQAELSEQFAVWAGSKRVLIDTRRQQTLSPSMSPYSDIDTLGI